MGRIFSVILLLLLSVNVFGQTLYEWNHTTEGYVSLDPSPTKGGQVFTIGNTGTNQSFVVDSIAFYIHNAVEGVFTFELFSLSGGYPTGSALSSKTVYSLTVGYNYIDMPSEILYSSTSYAIILTSSLNVNFDINFSEYSGGSAIFYDAGTWSDRGYSSTDLLFEIYGHRNTTITTHPVSQTKCVGQSVTFTVGSDAVSPTYQWKKNGSNISGQTSSSYTISSVASSDAANYTCTVTESALGVSTTSNAATLTVPTTTSISSHPSSISRCPGTSATFSVTASGASLTYQWKKNGTNISGATSTSYTIASVATGDAANYTVTVTGTCGTVTSNTAVLTVLIPPSISVHPVSQTKDIGESVTFSVTASGTSITYQWRKDASNISGATSSSYTISSVSSSDAGNYDVVITNTCASTTSNTATLSLSSTCDSIPSLVLYFDENISDSSIYAVPITNYANTFSTSINKQGTASWYPNSSSGRILTTNAYDVGTTWTASFWIYATASSGTKILMSNISGGGNDGFYISIDFTTNTILFRSWDALLNEGYGSSTASCFSDGVWFHLVVIVNGSTCSFYVNGTDVTSDGVIQDDFINNAVLSFGAFTGGASALWGFAYVDNLQLYKYVLPSSVINELYTNGALNYTIECSEGGGGTPVVSDRKKILLAGKLRNVLLNNIERDFGENGINTPIDYPYWTPDVLSGKVLYVDVSGSSGNDGLTESSPVTISDIASKIDNTFDFIAISDTAHYGTITIDNVDKTYGDTLILTTWVKYNSGHKAQIKGLSKITSWTQDGNFWYKSGISGLPLLRNDIYNEVGMDRDVYMKSHMNGIYINDTYYEVSKYPDSKTYYSIESTDGSSYVTDNQGVATTDYWNGATMASEVSTWINSKYTVTDYASNGTYYISNIYGSVYPVANMKYFLVNHRNAANNNGEWIIDHTTNRVDIYYDSDLNNEEVYLPTVDYVLELSNSSYVEVKNLSFYGANKIQVHNYQNLGASVNNCDFYRSPYAAIGFYGCDSSYAESNNIFYSGDNGIVSVRSDYNYFADNYIKGCGLTGTFGGDRDGLHLNGILTDSDYGDVIIERNIIDSTGYCGILEKDASEAINVSIQDNYVNGAMQLVSDGAGIYTFWNPYAIQKYIRNNLVTNTYENYAYHRNGTSESRAIYVDEGYPDGGALTYNRMWLIDSNVVYKYPLGFYQNRETRKIHWRDNILADQQFYVTNYDYSYNYNTSSESGWNADSSYFTKNIVVAGPDVNGSVVYFTPDATIAEYENLIDSNRYVNPFADDGIIWLTNSGSPSYTRTLRDTIWVRANSTFEDNTTYNDLNWGFSDVSGITEDQMIWCFANWSSTEHIFSLGSAVFKDISTGSNVSSTLTLQPYKANVYLYVSGSLSGVDDPIYEDRTP